MKRTAMFVSLPAALVAATLILGACGGGAPKATATAAPKAHFETVAAGSLIASVSVPVPRKAVLDITGRITRPNAEGALSMDLATLERLPISSGSIYEPFVKARTSFSGVRLSDLMTAAGADASATGVFVTALDDYTWTLPMGVVRSGEVLLATRENGQPIPVDRGGPIRLIFSDASTAGKETDAWVWSVRGLDVR